MNDTLGTKENHLTFSCLARVSIFHELLLAARILNARHVFINSWYLSATYPIIVDISNFCLKIPRKKISFPYIAYMYTPHWQTFSLNCVTRGIEFVRMIVRASVRSLDS